MNTDTSTMFDDGFGNPLGPPMFDDGFGNQSGPQWWGWFVAVSQFLDSNVH